MGASLCSRVTPYVEPIELPEQEECCVCLTRDNLRYLTLDCGHKIHARCVMKWWQEIPTRALSCPICSQDCTGCYMIVCYTTKFPICFYKKESNAPKVVFTSPHNGRRQTYMKINNKEDQDKAYNSFMASGMRMR